jgi:hypothetical protein
MKAPDYSLFLRGRIYCNSKTIKEEIFLQTVTSCQMYEMAHTPKAAVKWG